MVKGGQSVGAVLRGLRLLCVATPMIFGLSACAVGSFDDGLMGAVVGNSGSVSDNPSPIRAMKEDRADYPTLGSVPPRPTGLSTEAQRQVKMDKLAGDRATSRRRKAETEAIPMPTPLEVPAKPNLQPGKS